MNKIYNQNFNLFKNDCVPVTNYQILRNMYWVDFKYSFIDATINFFFKLKILLLWWASFELYYNKFAEEINKKLWINLKVKKLSIYTAWFEQKINNWYSFWLWLRLWNKEYLNAIKKGYLTTNDIDNIAKQGWGFQHNNCYWLNTLYEIYTWEEIILDLDTLKYWVKKWVFWSIARSFEWWDKFTKDVWSLLKRWKDDESYNPYISGKKTTYDIKVQNKAWDILLKYEFINDDWDKRKYNLFWK